MSEPTLKEANDLAKRVIEKHYNEVAGTRMIKEALEEAYRNGFTDGFKATEHVFVINGVRYVPEAQS